MTDVEELTKKMLEGDRRSIARLLTIVENDLPEAQECISKLYPHTGEAYILGMTGPPGVGKSTLIEKLVREIRKKGETVGVVAVDPTSPFSGGAFLGDRVRMQSLSTDEGVFIRSMATRGGVGGVARATRDAVKILDASGIDFIIIETVGAGQSEVEIMRITDTVVVILSPATGDDIQAMKAGMMEIGDIFVVNKSDLKNAEKTVMDINSMLAMQPEGKTLETRVVKTVALTGEGVTELLDTISQHREYIRSVDRTEHKRQRVEEEVVSVIRDKATEHILRSLIASRDFEEIVKKVINLETDPYTIVDEILSKMIKMNVSNAGQKVDR